MCIRDSTLTANRDAWASLFDLAPKTAILKPIISTQHSLYWLRLSDLSRKIIFLQIWRSDREEIERVSCCLEQRLNLFLHISSKSSVERPQLIHRGRMRYISPKPRHEHWKKGRCYRNLISEHWREILMTDSCFLSLQNNNIELIIFDYMTSFFSNIVVIS